MGSGTGQPYGHWVDDMRNPRQKRKSRRSDSGHDVNRNQSAFEAACVAVLDRSLVATAATEGEQHLVRYANPAFLELAGDTDDPGLDRPLAERFPALADNAVCTLLDLVHKTGEAAGDLHCQTYAHPQRGPVLLTIMAWPCGSRMTLIQYFEATEPTPKRGRMESSARDLRSVNERLLVAGVREHERAQETARRLAVAEEAVERSESALQSSFVQRQSLARRLITAQEAERTRLARELHDDVNQQLAGLAIALSVLRRGLPESLDEARSLVDRLQQRTTIIIETIRDLSYELHPGSLRSAGLLPALRRLCAEITQHTNVVFRTEGDHTNLPSDVSLTLYRVAQEALRNVTLHADARHTEVILTRDADGIELQIRDDGDGFVNNDQHRGLGLLGMEERVLVVNGQLTIDSHPGLGTGICVWIPASSLISRESLDTEAPMPNGIHVHAALE
jgi:signal transduction histidine kinase